MTVEPPSQPMTPEAFRQRVKKAQVQLRDFVDKRGNARLQEHWSNWEKRLRELYRQSSDVPDVAISMVGGTGAGKSTLLNALIEARVLPVSNMRACTAAISEVSFTEGAYRAKVEFVSRQSWEKEIRLLQDDLRAAQSPDEDTESGSHSGISRAALDKLWTVYRRETHDKASFDALELTEPREITRALDAGSAEVECATLSEFRKAIATYLDSKHRFWPLVKRVSISGPFEALRDGVKLIDLPGVNDPNEAREEVTRNHLKTCRFVWIVFNIKRALTGDIVNLMQSDDFLRQIVMDGRTDALTFVGTASDDIDLETAIDEFDLDEEAEPAEAVAERNRAVRDVIHRQLEELAHQMARLGHESPETAAKLAKQLKASQILTVSAREFLRIRGLCKSNPAGLSTVDQTQVPALQRHMQETCSRYGVEAHIKSMNRQFSLLANEIRGEIQSQQAALENQARVSEKQRQELEAAVRTVTTFLGRDLKSSTESFAQDLDANQSLLAERIKRAVDRAGYELQDITLRRWSRTHHGTLGACCRRGGADVGSTGRTDLSADLCKPILDGIAFAWSEFFGEKLKISLEKATDRTRRDAAAFQQELLRTVATTSELPGAVTESLASIFETTDKVLDEILAQLTAATEAKLLDKQRTIYEQIPTQVNANMQSAFQQAATESGAGMKNRMVTILSKHAEQVSQTMFDDATETLTGGVRSLNNWLQREYGRMTQLIVSNAQLAAENLVSVDGDQSHEQIASHQKMLGDFHGLIDEMDDVDDNHAAVA